MPDYYNSIDVLLCASAMEGTPNPVLEAMACGVPVISTDVGVVPEVLGPLQSDFIVPRDPGAMAAAIRRLHLDRGLLQKLSRENLARIEGRDWASLAPSWRDLLAVSQAEHQRGRGRLRTDYVLARFANLELRVRNAELEARVVAQEASLRSIETALNAMTGSLRTIQEVASWQRKMLRPLRWVWVRALPVRAGIAQLRGRR
jgi:hypothetical protein